MHVRLVAVVVILMLSAGAAACAELSVDDRDGTGTQRRDLTIETREGRVSLLLDGQLPPEWPSGFPVPPGSTPAGSGTVSGPEQGFTVAVYHSGLTAEQTFEYYGTNPELTVTSSSSVGVGKALVGRVEISGTYDGSVNIGGNAGSDLIVVLLRAPGSA